MLVLTVVDIDTIAVWALLDLLTVSAALIGLTVILAAVAYVQNLLAR